MRRGEGEAELVDDFSSGRECVDVVYVGPRDECYESGGGEERDLRCERDLRREERRSYRGRKSEERWSRLQM
ncbi:hypothetical protein Tco_0803165 [Tanacetum coccineum]|uniref:Uncharacterized protein n=1 Tax=Tanacetum coccineum TaxID=301880 RepID=A0ABQ5A1R2_9ASTR